MGTPTQQYEALIRSAAQRLQGHARRLFQAEVAKALGGGSARAAERRFGWGRDCVATGLHEADPKLRCLEHFVAPGALPREAKDPPVAAALRAIVGPHTQADPGLKSPRRYTNLSAREVLEALQRQYGYRDDRLPKGRTLRDLLNRMGYRLKRIQKARPLKKTKDTDALFANVTAARAQYRDDPEALEISVDTKAKVNEGGYARGGEKGRTDSQGQTPKGLDHDPPAQTKWTPWGVLMLATGALTLIFTSSRATSDFWVDALQVWWRSVQDKQGPIKRLVTYLDNGPKNSGTRTQGRRVAFCDWSGLAIRLVYYPP